MTGDGKRSPMALIAEDDEKLSVIVTEAMRQAGFDARVYHDGADALKTIQVLRPAVVVLDLHLPQVSGEEILKTIRQTPELAQMRVIITTADATLAAALRQPGDLVFIKPISFLQLRDVAKQLRAAITPAD